ncbi:sigma-70 family RNA polymerase sigma factor [Sanguibacter massiliensis]|uniref:sigma-70 family RNA polymerase sigma factor n=1 Tax=Sanguibacter massiliensis TaxID=1973217 RepID=UPI0013ECDE9B|nr:sigma-70 family RNA polymerase sigma factor [Sanguibacter massiliensis]
MSEDVAVGDYVQSDAELITAVRRGDTAAFGVLFARHSAAATAVARRYLPESDADDAVAGAFEKVLGVLNAGKGPDVAFRAYLFTVVRRGAVEMLERGRRAAPTDDDRVFESAVGPLASSEDPALKGFEDRTVARAFQALPERWRSVLWYTDIEGVSPAEVAPALGMTPNAVSALAYRAREGLRQAYLQAHLADVADDDACARMNAQLGAYVRGGLSRREATRGEAHLEDCGRCRAVALELGDLAAGMRATVAPLVVGLLGLAALGGLPLVVAGAGASAAGAAGLSLIPI